MNTTVSWIRKKWPANTKVVVSRCKTNHKLEPAQPGILLENYDPDVAVEENSYTKKLINKNPMILLSDGQVIRNHQCYWVPEEIFC